MGLSHRRFTREFKLAAVRRLEEGVSIAEVARALEVNPNVLHRWRRELRQGPGNAFPGHGQPALVGRADISWISTGKRRCRPQFAVTSTCSRHVGHVNRETFKSPRRA